MPGPSAIKRRRIVHGKKEADRKELEIILSQLEEDDYVMPGWRLGWAGTYITVTFQPVHQAQPEKLTEREFRMWMRGWDARRAAVMARRPRKETVRQRR